MVLTNWGCVLLLGLSLQLVIAQDYFDFGFDNPLADIWYNRNANTNTNGANTNTNQLIPDTRRACTVGTGKEGSCMNSAACRFQRGTAEGRGTCSLWNTCCVFEKSANQTSDARITYFVSTPGARQLPQAQKLYVRLANRNICQMRVDIISMNLLPPTTSTTTTSSTCIREYLRVDPSSMSNPIPLICGNNANNHFYVHLDSNQLINNGIILSINLDTTLTTEPEWNIKITQLECPGSRNILSNLQIHKNIQNQVASDFNQLAPARCLQYFTEPTGTINNFGYTSPTVSQMTTEQDYGICFRAIEGSCGVRLTKTFLNLRSTPATPATCAEEAIIIPESDQSTDKFCTDGQITTDVISKHPGPLYLHVRSNDMVAPIVDGMQYGFSFTYANSEPCNA